MKGWTTYCIVCGNAPTNIYLQKNEYDENNDKKIIEKLTKNIDTNWLNDIIVLIQNGKIIKGKFKLQDYPGIFFGNDGIEYLVGFHHKGQNNGIMMHSDCYKYISKFMSNKKIYCIYGFIVDHIQDRTSIYNSNIYGDIVSQTMDQYPTYISYSNKCKTEDQKECNVKIIYEKKYLISPSAKNSKVIKDHIKNTLKRLLNYIKSKQ